MSHTEKIFVIGHRNPDTDSICSAIAYAELCRKQGRSNVFPARSGHLNRQTEFVLEALSQEPPVLLTDVYPRVRDTLSGQPAVIVADAPLMRALELMRRHDIRMLPVVEDDGQPLGALILKRLPEHIFLPREGRQIRQVLTSPASVQDCLQAEAVCLDDPERTEELELFVGAMSRAGFQKHLAGVDPKRTIVLTGDRREIHQDAITMGVRLLIVTGGLSIDGDLVAMARDNGVSILQSPFDTATSALLARMSTPVRHLAEADVPRAHPDDRLDELRVVLMRSRAPGALVIEDGQVCGVATKSNLLRSSSLKLILVDHNELSQSVPGADQVDILEVIDHHRLGNFHTDAPIRFINQPVGSTCSLVATLYRQANITPEPKIAGLLLSGLLSDTVLFKSPTTTAVDHELAPWLGACAGIDPLEFGQKMFLAGSVLAEYPTIQALLMSDFKEYAVEETRFGVSQIEVVTFQEFNERREELRVGLEKFVAGRGLALAGLLVTDIVQQNSLMMVCGDKGLMATIGYPQVESGLFELKGVMSRKKQLMPHLLRAFKGF